MIVIIIIIIKNSKTKSDMKSSGLLMEYFFQYLNTKILCFFTQARTDGVCLSFSVSPLSLLALKACCEHLSLNRRCVDIDNPHVIACVSNTLKGGDGGMWVVMDIVFS